MNDVLWWPGWVALALAACGIGLIFAATFAIRYHRRTKGEWHHTPEGRWTMYRRLVEAGVFALTLINSFWPGWPGSLPLSALLLAAFALQGAVPHYLLTLAYRDRDREPAALHSPKEGQ